MPLFVSRYRIASAVAGASIVLFLLSGCQSAGTPLSKPIRTLLLAGGTSHDYDQWYGKADAATLEEHGLATVTYTQDTTAIAKHLPGIDVLYLVNNQPIKDPAVRQAIMDFVDSGKGLVIGHAANWYNWKDWPEYNSKLVGGGSTGHDAYGTFKVDIVNARHPVTSGVRSFALNDERYHYAPDAAGAGIEVLAEAKAEGSDKIYPSVFVVRHPQGRIVGITLGHDGISHELPQYRTLLRNAVKWAGSAK